ncbi:MAG: hypothetical protein JST00_05010 [Deltaproteobacteria bacterium]|nr:hypothetical protein [Deltaproteobacteria bacterium]
MRPNLCTSLAIAFSITSLAACAAPQDEPPVARTEPVAPGGQGAEAIEPGPEPPAVPGMAAGRPCGEYTAARVPGAAGETLTVCLLPSGHELIAVTSGAEEVAPEVARPRCAVDVFVKRAAPGVPVPRALVDSCARKTGGAPFTGGREVVDHAVFVEPSIVTAISPKAGVTISNGNGSAYCDASGASSFQSAQCLNCNGFAADECAAVCVPQLWGTSQRTCVEGDVAWETVASCGGSTRLRAFWREGSGDSWVTIHDDQVLANRYQKISITDGDWFADADMRFRAESASGAGHRHTFRCYDH